MAITPPMPEDHARGGSTSMPISRHTRQAGPLLVEVGAGELIDKITILRIKAARMEDPARLANVRHELAILDHARAIHLQASAQLQRLEGELMRINTQLWEIEDDIRACEKAQDFGAAFVALARAVYKTNDRRAAVKKEINLLTGALIVEEKSYAESA